MPGAGAHLRRFAWLHQLPVDDHGAQSIICGRLEPVAGDVFVQLARRRIGFRSDFPGQHFAETPVLQQRSLAHTGQRVDPHQGDIEFLTGGLYLQGAFQSRDGSVEVAI